MDRINTIGRRKASIARLYLEAGKGKITINNKSLNEFFPTIKHQNVVNDPLEAIEEKGKYDISVNVSGGGITGQAEATRLALSRALCEVNEEFRPILKKEGFLTRDSRKVERKKYGQRKARKGFQFSKR